MAAAATVTGPGVLAWQAWGLRRTREDALPPDEPVSHGDLPALAALAIPGTDSPLHTMVRSAPVTVARATTRAMLRRDLPTAAALTRWLAWLLAGGTPPPLNVPILLTHLRHIGGAEPRSALDIDLARNTLDGST